MKMHEFCIDITSRWDTFVLFHLYGNKGVSLSLWPIRPRWFHTYSPSAEPLGDGHEGMWARFGSQGSIALNWHSRYSGTWLYVSLSLNELSSNSRSLTYGYWSKIKTILPQSNMFTMKWRTPFQVMISIITSMSHWISMTWCQWFTRRAQR